MFKNLLHKDSIIYDIVNRAIESLYTLNIIDEERIMKSIEVIKIETLLLTIRYNSPL